MSRRLCGLRAHVGAATGVLSVLALLSYPLPTAWLGLGGLLALAVFRWRHTGRPFPASPFTLPLVLYLAGAAVGLYTTVRPQAAEVRFFGLLAALATFVLIVDGIRSGPGALRFTGAALIATLLAAILLFALVLPALRADRLPGLAGLLSGLITALTTPLEPIRNAMFEGAGIGQRYRFSSAGLGTLAAYGMGLALGPLLVGPSPRVRLLGGLCLGCFGLLLILPANRTAILTAALVPIVLLAMRYHWVLASLLLTLVLPIVGLSGLLRPSAGGQLDQLRFLPDPLTDLGPMYERLELWQNYLFLSQDFRFTGVGLGLRSVADVYQKRFLPVDPGFNHAHNMFLQSYLEQGALGLAGVLGLVTVSLFVGARRLRQTGEPWARMAAISGTAAVLALVLDGLVEIVPLTNFGMVMLMGALALMFVAGRIEEQWVGERPRAQRSQAPIAHMAARGAAALLALMVIVVTPTAAMARGPAPLAEFLAEPTQAPRVIAAQLYLNLGALELTKATMDENPRRRGREPHLSSAQDFLEQALQLDPDNIGAYRNLAELAIARSDLTEARRLLARAKTLANPGDSRFFFELGRLYRETGSIELAIAAWEQADRLMGAWSCSSPSVQLTRWGGELLAAGRWKSAAKVIEASIEAAPTEPLPYRLMFLALIGDGDEDAAFKAMHELVREQPNVPWPHLEMAKLHERAGHLEEASAWNQRAGSVRDSRAWTELRRSSPRARRCDEFLPIVSSEGPTT